VSRTFQSLAEAASEIRRDLAKGQLVESTRVQQHTHQAISGRERSGYEYTIMDGGFPRIAEDLVQLGQLQGFRPYIDTPHEMERWLIMELGNRLRPFDHLSENATEMDNPLLRGTIEGNWPSYTYRERLAGAYQAMQNALDVSMDSRRAFWPIFLPQDALRAGYPTRVPCSLGYEVMVRNVDGEPRLQMYYLSRSCDFDRFWLSDIWFAYRFGLDLAESYSMKMGSVSHYIISLHSFTAGVEEIY
jgi:hypothetical protein